MTGVVGVAQDFQERCVVDRRQQQERVENFGSLVLRVAAERLFERTQNLVAGERRVVHAVAHAGGPLGELLVQAVGQSGDWRQHVARDRDAVCFRPP